MPANQASKVKKAKGGKGKKDAGPQPKVDRESEAERARANAALWELRLKGTQDTLADCEKERGHLVGTNSFLARELTRQEKEAVDLTGLWVKREAATNEKMNGLEEQLRSQKELASEEKNKLVKEQTKLQAEYQKMTEIVAHLQHELTNMKEDMVLAEEDHNEALRNLENKFHHEKIRLKKEIREPIELQIVMMERQHLRVTGELEAALVASVKEGDRLSKEVEAHQKEAKEHRTQALLLAQEKTAMTLDRNKLVKKNAAQMEAQKEKLAEQKRLATSMQKDLLLATVELKKLKEKDMEKLAIIQASQAEVERLRKAVSIHRNEVRQVKKVKVKSKWDEDMQQFFREAQEHVMKEITANRAQDKKDALQDYRVKFRQATAGQREFPPVRTFHKPTHSTISIYSDLEAAGKWSYPPDSEVPFSNLTWEQKARVLEVLFSKMNGKT